MAYLPFFALILLLLPNTQAVLAQSSGAKSVDEILAEMGSAAARKISMDVCLPATSEEYDALGKNAVLMLTSSSAMAAELPLKTAYVTVDGVRVQLQRIAVFEKKATEVKTSKGVETYTEQVSFYLLPISFMKMDSRLAADFNGSRTDFGITRFSSDKSFLEGAPTFARVDAYDKPSDPDMTALAALLAREYPEFFGGV